MPDTEALRQSMADLTATAADLSKRVSLQGQAIRQNHRLTLGLIVSIILDIALTVGLVLNAHRVSNNQDKINHVQDSQSAVTQLNRENQCALINLFLSLEKGATTPNPVSGPEVIAQRKQAYAVIHQIHDSLHCPTVK